ncbi:hypothetical protein BTR22_07310 [Alkalihalophilus pseudofirmus]|uniref:LacI family DNA-binding transcriptional regulator n=1 Tax=Alkalihalophilus pseudofirmus TaxID=79885 RepID=UPI000952B79E|nr:hypothetical protein BTR22_07310 [Alkalihalophilus pseudofirmus]
MVTIYDIARMSGVSKSTVSRVVSNHPHVSAKTREKVLRVMQEHQFVPNSLATQFRYKHTKCIAIITPSIDHPYFSQLVHYLSVACTKKGFKTVIHQTLANKKTEEDIYIQLQKNEYDAIILASSFLTEEEIARCTKNRLLVACNEDFSSNYFDVFCINEEEVTMEATTYLLDKGLTKLAFCSDNLTSPLQQARLKGFRSAHNNKGLALTEQFVFDKVCGIEDGIQLGEKISKEGLPFEGILTGSDFVAAGLISSALRNNIDIPNQLSIIGFDDHPITLVTSPQISTIRNRIEEMSNDVITHILNIMNEGEGSPIKKIYKGEFIKRSSC